LSASVAAQALFIRLQINYLAGLGAGHTDEWIVGDSERSPCTSGECNEQCDRNTVEKRMLQKCHPCLVLILQGASPKKHEKTMLFDRIFRSVALAGVIAVRLLFAGFNG
jgi:hypothetical protein